MKKIFALSLKNQVPLLQGSNAIFTVKIIVEIINYPDTTKNSAMSLFL